MSMPPEPPPEGVLIESARKQHPEISIREAARRAGISEGWWRQVVKGYQSHSGGTYGTVRDVPAETVARMAKATGRVTPQQMEDLGQRADAAAIMRTAAPAAAEPAPLLRKERLSYDEDGAAGLHPYVQQVRREVYAAAGLLSKFPPSAGLTGGPDLPDPWTLPDGGRALERLPGPVIFPQGHEATLWDAPAGTMREHEHEIAALRKLVDDFGREQRNAVLLRA